MWYLLPLVVVLAPPVALAASRFDRRLDLFVTRLALSAFGNYVGEETADSERQRDRLRAAHVGETHRMYASKTLLYSAVLAVSGSVLGVYLAGYVLSELAITEETLRAALPPALSFLSPIARLSEIGLGELFLLLAFSGATVGTVLAVGTYYLRWELLDQLADARGKRIDVTLPRTVAFVYALSRSGMAFPIVLATLSRNERVYGEAARELSVAVREMETFSTDALTALRETAHRTPSENMAEFTENLASILESGQNLSGFLEDQYERFQEEAKAQQEQYLELLSTFAEAYVTTLVAGPLFLVTILVVVGLVLSDTLPILRLVIYLGVPLGSVAFIAYVGSATESLRRPGGADAPERRRLDVARRQAVGQLGADTPARIQASESRDVQSDGGTTSTAQQDALERLAVYDRYSRLLDRVTNPLETAYRMPSATFILTAPIGVLWVLATAEPTPVTEPVSVLAAIDRAVVEAAVFALGVYAVVFELRSRKQRAIERAVPDFLDRFASVNDAGMSVVRSLQRVSESDLDELSAELQRTWRDIQWGADVETALYRLEERVNSPMVSRAVALTTNAVHASGDIAPVLTIGADEARATRRLRREQRQVMLTYLIVIYISFLVFLGIVVALTVAFVPAVEGAQFDPDLPEATAGASVGFVDTITQADVGAYEELLFHATMIQALFSGLIAGQLGGGTIQSGAKHAVVLLVLGYLTFAVMVF
ncbi:archaeal flagellar protein FlaJ [Halalkaliarchaeum desulfuricum]|uniref:Archaeal flagellar protein FlaJ n=1 Tax=Halalkaliarchaeum desulfuricum TaxID=2055893 RepID=A0A343THT6_9EURY|nr:type II secretion system F family protein [Halalkaliarchaeum desulfuricum]AUX08658.1 archaeal flagellar protein FlaJ [Halalkaliarchaeum desulfuricum]